MSKDENEEQPDGYERVFSVPASLDALSGEQQQELLKLLREKFPEKPENGQETDALD
jgi:hypothetical protein